MGLLVLVSCASAPPPTPADPTVELEPPPTWTTEPPAPLPSVSLAEPWWTRWGDRRLGELIAEALERNWDLRAAATAVEAALAQARIAGADRLPQVAGRAEASSREQVFVGFPIPGRSGPLKTSSDAFSAALDVSWEADVWRRLRAGRSAVAADLDAARAELAAARLALAAQTARAWFTLLETERQVALAERTLESRRLTGERVFARYRAGVGAAVEVRLARTNEARAASVVEARRRQLDAARRQLELLLGRYPGGSLELGRGLPAVPEALPALLPAELVTRRPDLAAAERRLAAAGWRVAEARRAIYPQIRFSASAGTTSDVVRDLVDTDFSVWNLAGSLLAPIFQGGRLRAAVDFAEASRERALAEYVGAVLRAFLEVEEALAAERFLAAEEAALVRALEEAEAAAKLAEDRYTAGVGEFLDILESQRQAFAAETQLLAVQRGRLIQRIDLHVALGDGFQAETP